jgi:hypothetical protein
MLDHIVRTIGTKSADADPVQAHGVVSQQPGGRFAATVTLSSAGQTEERTVEGESCHAVANAVVLIVALAVNPDASLAPAVAPVEVPPPVVSPPIDAAPRVPVAWAPRYGVGAAASVLVDGGSLPKLGLGGEIALSYRPGALELEAVGQALGARATSVANRPSEGASFWMLHAGARACYHVLEGRFDLAPCLGVGAEWVFANGFGSVIPLDAVARLGVGSVGVKALFGLRDRLNLRVMIEGAAPVNRPTYFIDGAGLVYETAPIWVRGALGFEARF